MRSPSSAYSTVVYWVLQCVGWGCEFWAQASGEVIFASVPWSQAGSLWGGVCLGGMALTQTLRSTSKRGAWLEMPPARLTLRIFSAVLSICIVHFFLTVALSEIIYGTPISPVLGVFYVKLPLHKQLLNQFIVVGAVDILWVALYFSFVTHRHRYTTEIQRVQLTKALQSAELRLLKAQINPHFLFNALNGVRALIADEPGKAQDAVTQLARTMRYALAAGSEDLVTLSRELEMVDDYLALESLRLAKRLRVVSEIEAEARAVRVPAMIVQSLVENAIKHGIAKLQQGGTLHISARVVSAQLLIRIVNPRPLTAARSEAADGVGIINATERLRLLFGSASKLDLDLSVPGQATVDLRVPV